MITVVEVVFAVYGRCSRLAQVDLVTVENRVDTVDRIDLARVVNQINLVDLLGPIKIGGLADLVSPQMQQ